MLQWMSMRLHGVSPDLIVIGEVREILAPLRFDFERQGKVEAQVQPSIEQKKKDGVVSSPHVLA